MTNYKSNVHGDQRSFILRGKITSFLMEIFECHWDRCFEDQGLTCPTFLISDKGHKEARFDIEQTTITFHQEKVIGLSDDGFIEICINYEAARLRHNLARVVSKRNLSQPMVAPPMCSR